MTLGDRYADLYRLQAAQAAEGPARYRARSSGRPCPQELQIALLAAEGRGA